MIHVRPTCPATRCYSLRESVVECRASKFLSFRNSTRLIRLSRADKEIMIFQKSKRILLSLIAILFLVSALQAQTKLLRFPDVHADKIVFTYGGDLCLPSPSGVL